MATGLMILTSLHVALTTVAIVTGLRLIAGMMLGHVTSEVIPIYFSTTLIVCATSSQLLQEAPPATAMVGLICLLSALTAMHARYFGRMYGAYATIYAVAASISVIALVAGAALQSIAALPELRALLPLLASRSNLLLIFALSIIAIALAVRGLRRAGNGDLWAGSAN